MPRCALACLALGSAFLLMTGRASAQPGVANRCVVWGGVTLEDGTRSMRFAPEPWPAGPCYLHYIATLNGDERHILTELAPKWDPREDVNIPGNGFWGCELGNLEGPEAKPGDKVQIVVTDEAAGQQGVGEFVVPSLPGAINCDVRLTKAAVDVPLLNLRGDELSWAKAAATTLVYQRLAADRYPNARPRGQYTLAAKLTGGETCWRVADATGSAWLIVQQDGAGHLVGRSREARAFADPDGYPSLIAVAPSGRIVTMDVGAGEVTVRDADGKSLRSFRLADGFQAQELWAEGARVIAQGADAAGGIHWASCDLSGQGVAHGVGAAPGVRPSHVPSATLSPRATLDLGGGKRLLLDGLGGGLSLVSGGKTVGIFRGQSFGGFRRPRDLAVGPEGTVYVLEGTRICLIPAALEEEMPMAGGQGAGVTVRWRTGRPMPSLVRVVGQGTAAERGDGHLRMSHAVRIGELPRPGRYRMSVAHSIRFIGAEPEWATSELLIPPIRRGQTAHLRVKVAVVIVVNARPKKPLPPGVEWPGPVGADEIEHLKGEVRRAVLFYWINSHLRFFVDVDFLVDATLHEFEPGSEEDAPNRDSLAAVMRANGKRLDDYDGVCRVTAEQEYDVGAKAWRLTGRGGGLTMGVSRDHREPGYSWWLACPRDYPIPDGWLFVHEFNHQVDSIFDASGHPEYWSPHFAPSEGKVGRFGEHFDGNAYLLRHWPEEKWFASDWGRVEFAADADGDGVPDDAPWLPLDEKRFGSDPHQKDTDGVGLDDRAKIMAWNGIITGLGQTWASPILPHTHSSDAVMGGPIDWKRPFPPYPIPDTIPRRDLMAGGKPASSARWPVLHHFSDGGLEATTSVAWSDQHLCIGCRLSSPQRVQVQLDARNDGWFVGHDNVQLTVSPPREAGGKSEVEVHTVNAAVPGKWPFDDPTLMKAEEVACACSTDGVYTLVIAVPRSEKLGLLLRAGERIGLNISYGNPSDPNHMLALFQPHALVPLTLGR